MRISVFSYLGILLSVIFGSVASMGIAQDSLRNWRWEQIGAADTTVLQAQELVLSHTLIVFCKGEQLDKEAYRVKQDTLFLLSDVSCDTLLAQYRVLSPAYQTVYQHKDRKTIDGELRQYYDPFKSERVASNQDPFDFGSVSKQGSISRGITVGNRQDLTVQSDLQLQLSGRLTDKIKIKASISDNDVPIQPSGHTQQIQDFDQVFVQLYDQRNMLTAGDFMLQRNAGHFARYLKKAQGLKSEHTFGSDDQAHVSAALAFSKGKFARQTFQGEEGNQGPYRLKGPNGELFIMVLSGTERVYIDGVLLKRGQQYDYIIDYNSSEITFMPRQLITKDKRVVVEFQYADRNFARSIYTFQGDVQLKKWKVYGSVYAEQDLKNQAVQQTLEVEDRTLLGQVGDQLQLAVVPSFDSTSFSNDFVLYELQDTLGFDSVFVQSTSTEEQLYQVRFSQVGQGNGDYVFKEFSASGRVYEWVSPVLQGGVWVAQGDFAPVIQLLAPTKQHVYSLGASRETGKWRSQLEGALSLEDINTFSTLDAGDNLGYAVKSRQELRQPLAKKGRHFKTFWDGEYTSSHFKSVERIRNVEFVRDWNLQLDEPTALMYNQLGVGIEDSAKGNVTLSGYSLLQDNSTAGTKLGLQMNWEDKKWKLLTKGSYLSQRGGDRFMRDLSTIQYRLPIGNLGIHYDMEDNLKFNSNSDTLLGSSYAYHDWQLYLSELALAKGKARLSFQERTDIRPYQGQLGRSTQAQSYKGSYAVSIKKDQLDVSMAWRTLQVEDTLRTTDNPDETLLSTLHYKGRWFRSFLDFDVYYENGSGVEQKREFVYLEVPIGQGTHIWVDYDGDGVKDLEEFEISAFGYDADHMRIFTPSDTYVRAFNNQYRHSVLLKPAALFDKSKGALTGWKGAVGKLGLQSAMQIQRKTIAEDVWIRYNPFQQDIADDVLLSTNSNFRNTLFFDRFSAVFGWDWIWFEQNNKILLAGGIDTRNERGHEWNVRYNIKKMYLFRIKGLLSRKGYTADYIANRNYDIENRHVELSGEVQPSRNYRFVLKGSVMEKQNSEAFGGEYALHYQIGFNTKYNVSGKGNIQVEFDAIRIVYTGEENGSVAFEMLQGLKTGQNYTWGLNWMYKLSSNLQLTVHYNGRKSENTPVIHVGSMQVRALF